MQTVTTNRGGQFSVDNSSVDKKHFGSTADNSHGRPHSSSLRFDKDIQVKRILNFFCRRTFLAEAIVTAIARPPFWAKPSLAIPSCGRLYFFRSSKNPNHLAPAHYNMVWLSHDLRISLRSVRGARLRQHGILM